MANTVNLKIMTPEGIFWNESVDIVTVKTTEGYIGLQHGRSPFVASLDIAELKINSSNSAKHKVCAVAGGLVFMDKAGVSIITDAIEYKDRIDLARAERKRKEAELALKAAKSEAEEMEASVSLKKAINRIHVRGGN